MIEPRFDDEIVRHGVHQLHAGQLPAGAVLFTWVAHGDVVVHCAGDLREKARQLAGADDEQSPARTVDGGQHALIELLGGAGRHDVERDGAGGEVEAARQQFVTVQALQQFGDGAGAREWFDGQLNGAAAGQAEAVRFVGGDAVADQLRGAACDAVLAHALDQVVLDAAAGDGSDYAAIVADGQQRADRTRAGAPGLDDGDELAAVTGVDPRGGGLEYFQVDAVHGSAILEEWIKTMMWMILEMTAHRSSGACSSCCSSR